MRSEEEIGKMFADMTKALHNTTKAHFSVDMDFNFSVDKHTAIVAKCSSTSSKWRGCSHFRHSLLRCQVHERYVEVLITKSQYQPIFRAVKQDQSVCIRG